MNATPSDNLGGLRYLLLNEVFTLSHLVIVKLLGIEFASVQIVFIRCFSSAVLLVPLLAWQGSFGEIRAQLSLNSLRVLLSSVAITINFFTISQIQLAQMSTIGYLRPAVTSLIAYFFLKESQSSHRWGTLERDICIVDNGTHNNGGYWVADSYDDICESIKYQDLHST